jgi:outer membrane protein TolC
MPVSPQLALTTRTAIEPDTSEIPTEAGTTPQRPRDYRRLTVAECTRFAIANAPLANDLDQHPENELPSHAKLTKKATEFAEASRLIRGHTADELRNRAAADALEDYFKLAEAEGQFDLLAAASTELRTQLDAALAAEKAGFRDRADIPTLRRKLLDLEAKLAQLQAAIGGLNASLRARLGLPANDSLPLWPAHAFKVKADDVDAEQAVATGLHYRPDLNVLRSLANGNAGDATNAVLAGLNPLLAKLKSDHPLAVLFAVFTREPERQQAAANARVASVLVARQRQAEAEIRAAVLLLRGHRSAVAARMLDVQQVESRIAELETKAKAGVNVTAELATAKLEFLTAKGELLSSVMAWHIAEMKLRQAMGLLVRE